MTAARTFVHRDRHIDMGRAFVALAAVLVLASCGLRPAVPAGTGIEGVMMIGPTCPVQRVDSPCPDRPYAGEVSVRDQSGSQVADVYADSGGHFRVAVAPGTYDLVPRSPHPGVPPTGKPQTVTVVSGQYAEVIIEYDSGIR